MANSYEDLMSTTLPSLGPNASFDDYYRRRFGDDIVNRAAPTSTPVATPNASPPSTFTRGNGLPTIPTTTPGGPIQTPVATPPPLTNTPGPNGGLDTFNRPSGLPTVPPPSAPPPPNQTQPPPPNTFNRPSGPPGVPGVPKTTAPTTIPTTTPGGNPNPFNRPSGNNLPGIPTRPGTTPTTPPPTQQPPGTQQNRPPPPTDSTQNQQYLDQLRNGRPRFGSRGGTIIRDSGSPNLAYDPNDPEHNRETPRLGGASGHIDPGPGYTDEYYERFLIGSNDGNENWGKRLKPEWVKYFKDKYGWDLAVHGGPVQIGYEGFPADSLRDPTKVYYDPEFGLVTFEGNLIDQRDWWDTNGLFTLGSLALGGITGVHALGGSFGASEGLWIDPNSGGFLGPAGSYGGVPAAGATGGLTTVPTNPTAPTNTSNPNTPPPDPNAPPPPGGPEGPPPNPNQPPPGTNTAPPNPSATPPANTPPPGPPGTTSWGAPPNWLPEGMRGLWQAGGLVWDGAKWIVRVAGTLNTISTLTGNGPLFPTGGGNGPPSNRSGPPGSGPPDSNNPGSWEELLQLLGIGGNQYLANKDFQKWWDMTNELINKGDWGSRDRPKYIDMLREFELDPNKALEDPGYQALRDRASEDLSRKMNARGMGLSGNELGDLTKLRTEMDYKHIEERKKSLREAAGLGDPRGMIAAGLHNLPSMFAQKERDRIGGFQAAGDWLSKNLPGLIQAGGRAIENFMNWITGNGQLDHSTRELIRQGAAARGISEEEFIREFRRTGPREWGGDSDGPSNNNNNPTPPPNNGNGPPPPPPPPPERDDNDGWNPDDPPFPPPPPPPERGDDDGWDPEDPPFGQAIPPLWYD